MSSHAAILQQFLVAGDAFVSGTQIARSLGCSRVNVHKHLESLRSKGFQFEAAPRRGYRLQAEPPSFNPDLFRACLLNEPLPYYRDFHYQTSTASTNSDAEQALAAGHPAPVLVVAGAQTAGRGRRGRSWHSPPDQNLYLSVGLRPELPPARLKAITLFLGLAVCRYLKHTYQLPVSVKWPNDLLIQNRKLAGMLTEARVNAEHTREMVFGIGLNANSSTEDFPRDLQPLATSLAIASGKRVPITRLAHGLASTLADALSTYLSGPHAPTHWIQLWNDSDALLGQEVLAGDLSGTAAGITSTGSLRLRRPDGSLTLLHSGEVSVRPARP